MLPFYALIFIPIAMTLFPAKLGRRDKILNPIRVFYFIFFLILALRHPLIGNDTGGYLKSFSEIANTPWGGLSQFEWEYGFIVLTKLISCITTSPQVYLAIVSLLIILPLFIVFSEKDINPVLFISLSLIMPTFTMMFSGLRQALAISVGVLVYEATKNRRIVFALLLCLLAFLFHKSAFILLLIIPVFHIKFQRKHIPIIAAAFVLTLAFNRPIFSILEKVFGDVYSSAIVETKAYTMLIMFVLFAVLSFLICSDNNLDREGIGLRNILILVCLLQCFVPLHNLAMRMNYYFIILVPLEVCKILKAAESTVRWRQVAVLCKYTMCVFFILFFFVRVYTGNVRLSIFPYHFFWENF